METILIKALQLILSLSILVLVHEFGHFMFARIFKVRVEKFYLFFNPWFTLFKYKPKNSDTEYGLGWLPLGGYCKISGMIDESMDKKQMALPPQPWEFRSKPAGQRLLIMTGGVLLNFILAFLIYSMVLLTWGDKYIPLKDMTMGMSFSETGKSVGFQDGDILKSADGKHLERIGIITLLDIIEAKEVTVLRDGKDENITIPEDFMAMISEEKKPLMSMRYPFVIDSIKPNSIASASGIQIGDSLVGIGDNTQMDYTAITDVFKSSKNAELSINVYRKDSLMQIALTTDTTGIIGVSSKADIYNIVKIKYNFFTSFPAGIQKGIDELVGYARQAKYIFSKTGIKNVGGFGTIANIFPAKWDWHAFWMMTAFLSIILGFMNILPIPALDGGHVMFLLYEVVTRRKPNEKFMEYAQIAGMVILFGLIIYANGNDVFRAIFGK